MLILARSAVIEVVAVSEAVIAIVSSVSLWIGVWDLLEAFIPDTFMGRCVLTLVGIFMLARMRALHDIDELEDQKRSDATEQIDADVPALLASNALRINRSIDTPTADVYRATSEEDPCVHVHVVLITGHRTEAPSPLPSTPRPALHSGLATHSPLLHATPLRTPLRTPPPAPYRCGARHVAANPDTMDDVTTVARPRRLVYPYFDAPRFEATRFSRALFIFIAGTFTWVGTWDLLDNHIVYLVWWPCALSPMNATGDLICHACYRNDVDTYPPCASLKVGLIALGLLGLYHTRALYRDFLPGTAMDTSTSPPSPSPFPPSPPLSSPPSPLPSPPASPPITPETRSVLQHADAAKATPRPSVPTGLRSGRPSVPTGLRSGKARFVRISQTSAYASFTGRIHLTTSHSSNQVSDIAVLMLISFANLCCHAAYSLLPSFFPVEAAARGMGEDLIGITFAMFAAVAFACSPIAAQMMSRHGRKRVYLCGLSLVALATTAFGATAKLSGTAFTMAALVLRLVQGVGSALEETAAYAIVASLDPDRTSLYLGLCELSTGLGYMAGPAIGGLLYTIGGFKGPFVALGLGLVPAAGLIAFALPSSGGSEGEATAEDVGLASVAYRNPRVLCTLLVCVLANSDYALLEPTLGAHATAAGLADGAASIGTLFAISAAAYTVSCPLVGYLADFSILGPRCVIAAGLLLQATGLVLIGPSPLLSPLLHSIGLPLPLGQLTRTQLLCALVTLGLGDAASMTPAMDDMRHSLDLGSGDLSPVVSSEAVINTLSGAMASAFALGQVLGPLVGSVLTARVGFPWTAMGASMALLGLLGVFLLNDVGQPRLARSLW